MAVMTKRGNSGTRFADRAMTLMPRRSASTTNSHELAVASTRPATSARMRSALPPAFALLIEPGSTPFVASVTMMSGLEAEAETANVRPPSSRQAPMSRHP